MEEDMRVAKFIVTMNDSGTFIIFHSIYPDKCMSDFTVFSNPFINILSRSKEFQVKGATVTFIRFITIKGVAEQGVSISLRIWEPPLLPLSSDLRITCLRITEYNHHVTIGLEENADAFVPAP